MDLPPALSRVLPGKDTTDSSLAALLVANIITIVLAVLENWDLATVLFIYWAQSIIIGLFAVITILSADSATLAAEMNRSATESPAKKPAWNTRGIMLYKGVMAGFFCLHYGLFHWGYFAFIVEGSLFGPVNFAAGGVWAACGIFFCNHLYSFLYNRGKERQDVQSLNAAFFRPYNRIIPMHLTIIFGSIVVLILGLLGITTVLPVLVLFLVLKTYLDVRMHVRKHYEAAHRTSRCSISGSDTGPFFYHRRIWFSFF
jgi:hypothetical protein